MSRRSNIRIGGIVETANETWGKCEMKVQQMFKIKMQIEENIEIDCCCGIIPKKIYPSRRQTIIR